MKILILIKTAFGIIKRNNKRNNGFIIERYGTPEIMNFKDDVLLFS